MSVAGPQVMGAPCKATDTVRMAVASGENKREFDQRNRGSSTAILISAVFPSSARFCNVTTDYNVSATTRNQFLGNGNWSRAAVKQCWFDHALPQDEAGYLCHNREH